MADRSGATILFLHIHKDIDRQMQRGMDEAPTETVVEEFLESGEDALTRLVEDEFRARLDGRLGASPHAASLPGLGR